MRAAAVGWERAAEVREAAAAWRRAGVVDAPAAHAIHEAYPDPRVGPGPAWRALTAAMVSAVALCSLGAVTVAVAPGARGLGALLLAFAAACLLAADRLEGTPRFARRGAAGAAAFWGTVLFLVGLALLLGNGPSARFATVLDVVLAASVLAWAAGCWRWGHPLFAGFSATSLLVLLARLPQGRVLWIVAGTALVALAARRVDDAAWAPSHRRAAIVLLLVGVVAVYAAANVYSFDVQWLEHLRPLGPRRSAAMPGLRVLAAVATVALPPALLVWGWTSRRTVLLDTGVVLLALSLVTLRHYVHLAPLWVVLTMAGAVVVALALAVERALRRAPGGEMSGFTTDVLFTDERRQQLLQAVPVAVAFAPAAPSAPAEGRGFTGGGGRFGGGGASGQL